MIESRESLDDLHPETLRAGEVVDCHWSTHDGRGVLTNQRLMLMGHPAPIHRHLTWGVELDGIDSLSVGEIEGPPGVFVAARSGYGAFWLNSGRIDATYRVLVNGTTVYVGNPEPCAHLQRRIDDARTARCVAVHGRLLAYLTSPAGREGSYARSEASRQRPTPQVATAGEPHSSFVLFLAGEPYRNAVEARQPNTVLLSFTRGAMLAQPIGGHQDADLRPGQVYGPGALVGRLVLHIASTIGASVRVVNVDDAGPDAELVRTMVSPQDELPILARADGARLMGEEAFVAADVLRFLRGGKAG